MSSDTRAQHARAAMNKEQQLRGWFQGALEESNARSDEAFSILWEGTTLKKQMVSCENEIMVYIPEGVHRMSWNEDLVDFLYSKMDRFAQRVTFITDSKLQMDGYTLYCLNSCRKGIISFQGLNYHNDKYSVLEIRFQLELD